MSDRDDSRPFVEAEHLLRRTFTSRLENRGGAAALNRVAEIVFDWSLETLQNGPDDDLDPIAREILPAGEDLRLLGCYLRQVARHREQSSLTPAQRRMCDRAAAWAEKAEALGRKIFAALEVA